jgi:hypothetical protein
LGVRHTIASAVRLINDIDWAWPVSFSRALYYPWMQVRDLGWLKNALLFWDVVSTIVPRGLHSPYTTDDERALSDEGWLVPCQLSWDDEPSVRRASKGTLNMLDDRDVRARLRAANALSDTGTGGFEKLFEPISYGKYTVDLASELKRLGLFVDGRAGSWPSVDRALFSMHMAHLAHALATDKNLALVTDDHGLSPIADSLAIGHPLPASLRSGQLTMPLRSVARWYEGYDYRQLATGALSRYVLRTVGVTPETPVKDIVKFRHRYEPEMGRLREEIDGLAASVGTDFPTREAFEQAVLDVFKNRISPALKDLEGAKRGARLNVVDHVISGAIVGSPVAAALYSPGLSPTGKVVAAVTASGLALTSVRVRYAVERRKERARDPYSFVLAARREFGPGPEWHTRSRWWSPGRVRRPY